MEERLGSYSNVPTVCKGSVQTTETIETCRQSTKAKKSHFKGIGAENLKITLTLFRLESYELLQLSMNVFNMGRIPREQSE